MESFGARLHRAVAERGPLCVGIDPHPGLLAGWGLSDDVEGLERFSRTVVEALGDRVAVIKPQSAFFERFGSRGVGVLESTIRQLRDSGALVLLDVKRGDIGSTVSAYASAYLDPSSPLYVDAVTASPYLGVGSLAPMFELAAAHGGGVFVLALTSNPEGAAVQRAVGADGRTVAQTVIDEISQLNRGADPLGSFGLVVGATIGDTGHDLSAVHGPLLAPGLGAQGATAADLRAVFGSSLPSVLPSYSREVLSAGPDVAALRAAAERVLGDCRAALAGS
ncbi:MULTISPECIES: orotidine-5'-phosphate decarboxylase [Micromonospora]|uniref:Orotidine 5'-phosphate decarboxylase n=1 Tax=Micromonospora solifontis TaxID=2487138 RepID=A0ABX9WMI8_9ACTN|nr:MULTISPECIES: orotidine-5'-phosphate decarboxylase [Micromonospora]NES13495.1 orotidine-5'-phosphate decarboxylase [Micromonospora sp. PPF5-17B]NES35619.1 orotidine-5'-phosphate decarboxylase [Micromonospora solifontis]NES55489.1 orotidine-5'-phosphate decarboxylase [Micromonospora sp. PPF5-6]RNM00504.1 orotidine-5'-phosphate decarboxylase [Micromonospora solifontis]